MKIYKVFDEEFEEIMGEKQLKNFAISQVKNCEDDYLKENLMNIIDNTSELNKILDKVNQILNDVNYILTIKQSKKLLKIRGYNIQEIEVF